MAPPGGCELFAEIIGLDTLDARYISFVGPDPISITDHDRTIAAILILRVLGIFAELWGRRSERGCVKAQTRVCVTGSLT